MTGRKVASLSSSLLARKGAARPADGTVDGPAQASGPAAQPASGEPAPETAAAAPSAGSTAQSPRPVEDPVRPAVQPAPSAPSIQPMVARRAAETAETRPYAWPTQGPPSEDDIAMPPPPDEVALDAPVADPARARRRRLAVFAIAAVVVGGAAYLAMKDRGHDAATSATITAGVSEPATIRPESASPAAVPLPEGTPADEAAARAVRDVAPAAGTPGDAAVPPPPATKEPPAAVAAITTASVAPPPIDRPAPPPAPAEAMPAMPEPPVAARPAGAGPSTPEASGAKDTAAKAPARAAAGRYAVQLASVGSKQRAQEESVRLGKRLASVLGGRKPKVEPAEIAGRGTVYRIRVPGFASRGAARNACAKIKAGGGDCLVVRN